MTDFRRLLTTAPARPLAGMLARAVAAQALFPAGLPASPGFLLTTGRQNRFNWKGTECLYWAEDQETALAEYRRQFLGLPHGARQPVTLYWAEVRLSKVLDLPDEVTRRALGVTLKQLEADWGAGLPVTTAQHLGESVAEQSSICAIRYRSVAALKEGGAGCNVVVFKASLRPPDFVCILGPTKKPLQQWP